MSSFKIIPIYCGHIANHEKSSFVYRKNFGGERLNAPCTAWLLIGDEQTIIVDTGPGTKSRAPQCYTETEKNLDHLLANELERLTVDPNKIDIVILTHLHNDHVGGACLFQNAQFYVQERELREAVWPVPFQRPIYEVNQRGKSPAWIAILDRLHVLYGDTEIIPGITTILLPGHTAGSQGVLVDTGNRQYLIAGDLIPLYDNWLGGDIEPIPNGNHTDLRAYDASFHRLASLKANILPGHDPRVFDNDEYPIL